MSNNIIMQQRVREQKQYRRKVTAVALCSVVLVLLIILGLIKVIVDDNKEKGSVPNNLPGVSQTPAVTATVTPEPTTEPTVEPTPTAEPVTPAPTEVLTPTTAPTATTVPTSVPVSINTPVPVEAGAPLVVIDAGHGGEDLGTTRDGYHEKNANLAIALYLQEALEALGYRTYMIRTEDVSVENTERPAVAIEQNGDVYVSVHINSYEDSSIKGTEVWYSNLRNDGSKELAQYVVDSVAEATGTRNRGIKLSNNLIVLKYNGMAACLVECGYITSPEEREKLFSADYQQLVAAGIAGGIAQYLPIDR